MQGWYLFISLRSVGGLYLDSVTCQMESDRSPMNSSIVQSFGISPIRRLRARFVSGLSWEETGPSQTAVVFSQSTSTCLHRGIPEHPHTIGMVKNQAAGDTLRLAAWISMDPLEITIIHSTFNSDMSHAPSHEGHVHGRFAISEISSILVRVACAVDVSGIVGAATFAATAIIYAVVGCPALVNKVVWVVSQVGGRAPSWPKLGEDPNSVDWSWAGVDPPSTLHS